MASGNWPDQGPQCSQTSPSLNRPQASGAWVRWLGSPLPNLIQQRLSTHMFLGIEWLDLINLFFICQLLASLHEPPSTAGTGKLGVWFASAAPTRVIPPCWHALIRTHVTYASRCAHHRHPNSEAAVGGGFPPWLRPQACQIQRLARDFHQKATDTMFRIFDAIHSSTQPDPRIVAAAQPAVRASGAAKFY